MLLPGIAIGSQVRQQKSYGLTCRRFSIASITSRKANVDISTKGSNDGIVRIVERRSPAGVRDQHGKLAEQELSIALEARRTPPEHEIDSNTMIFTLCETYLTRLEEEGRSANTMSTYEFALEKSNMKIGGVRVAEATAGRIDTALRAMSKTHGPTMARQAKTILRGGTRHGSPSWRPGYESCQ